MASWTTVFERIDAGGVTLLRATVPVCLVEGTDLVGNADGLAVADIEIIDGRISAIRPTGVTTVVGPSIDLDRSMVWPGFVDCHTHLDKGHIWPRAANPDGTFQGAISTVMADRAANWSAADIKTRMEFALQCAYAHGTTAIRTHLDSRVDQTNVTWPVYAEMKASWQGRIALDASPLFPIDLALDDQHMTDVIAAVDANGHTLGAVTYMTPTLRDGLDRLFHIASERSWDLDFHVDESLDPDATSLRAIAETALKYKFQGRILVGHCCSLSIQADDAAARTMDLVAQAQIAVVSLPLCNLYLQDRSIGRTPRRRGVTLLHELKARGIAVAVASDNTRDPFYAYGDLDVLEVFREAVRIAHLDHPVSDWPRTVTATPAQILGMADAGSIKPGMPADLVIVRARAWSELLSRPQSDRVILRRGQRLIAQIPDYRALDLLFT